MKNIKLKLLYFIAIIIIIVALITLSLCIYELGYSDGYNRRSHDLSRYGFLKTQCSANPHKNFNL